MDKIDVLKICNMHCFIYPTETKDEKDKMRDYLIEYHEENKEKIKYTVISELNVESLEDNGGD